MIQYKVIFLDSIDVALATERLAVWSRKGKSVAP
jgi:hypothetical protein